MTGFVAGSRSDGGSKLEAAAQATPGREVDDVSLAVYARIGAIGPPDARLPDGAGQDRDRAPA